MEEFHKQCAMKKLKFDVFFGKLTCVSESFKSTDQGKSEEGKKGERKV